MQTPRRGRGRPRKDGGAPTSPSTTRMRKLRAKRAFNELMQSPSATGICDGPLPAALIPYTRVRRRPLHTRTMVHRRRGPAVPQGGSSAHWVCLAREAAAACGHGDVAQPGFEPQVGQASPTCGSFLFTTIGDLARRVFLVSQVRSPFALPAFALESASYRPWVLRRRRHRRSRRVAVAVAADAATSAVAALPTLSPPPPAMCGSPAARSHFQRHINE